MIGFAKGLGLTLGIGLAAIALPFAALASWHLAAGMADATLAVLGFLAGVIGWVAKAVVTAIFCYLVVKISAFCIKWVF